jgi:hypothetical protein
MSLDVCWILTAPVVGATVVADWVFVGGHWPRPRSAPSQQSEHEIVARAESDGKGNFELEFSKDSPREGRLSHSWHIAAFAPGYGPAWMRDVHLLKDRCDSLATTSFAGGLSIWKASRSLACGSACTSFGRQRVSNP